MTHFDFHHAIVAFASTTGSWWSRLSDNWKAILVIFAAIGVGWTGSQMKEDLIGRGSRIQTNEERLDTLTSRVSDITEWIMIHEDTVTNPGLTGISWLRQQDSIRGVQLDTITARQERIYCNLFEAECPARLPRRRGGQGVDGGL